MVALLATPDLPAIIALPLSSVVAEDSRSMTGAVAPSSQTVAVHDAPASVGLHVRRLLALALPSTIAQLGAMLLMVVDVLMLGRVGVAALDAASLGRVWALGTMVAAMGL